MGTAPASPAASGFTPGRNLASIRYRARCATNRSFASRIKRLLAARRKYRLAEGELIAVPEPKASALCLLVLKLPDHPLAVTALSGGRWREEMAR